MHSLKCLEAVRRGGEEPAAGGAPGEVEPEPWAGDRDLELTVLPSPACTLTGSQLLQLAPCAGHARVH